MKLKDYNADLEQRLLNLDEAGEYLTACYQESYEVFLLALRQIVDSHGGISSLSETTSLNRESLYRLLSENGNPQLSSLGAILNSLGLSLKFRPIVTRSKKERA